MGANPVGREAKRNVSIYFEAFRSRKELIEWAQVQLTFPMVNVPGVGNQRGRICNMLLQLSKWKKETMCSDCQFTILCFRVCQQTLDSKQ